MFQLQLSEVIIRARRFYQEVTGLKGFVHEGQIKKEAFEKRFKEQHIYDGFPEVQDWLSKMTHDKKGYYIYWTSFYYWRIFILTQGFFSPHPTTIFSRLKNGIQPLPSVFTE